MAFELSAQDLQWVLEGALAEALLSFSKLVKCFSSQPSPWRWSRVGIVCEQEELGVVAVPPWEGDGRRLRARFPPGSKGFVTPVICWQMGRVEGGEGTDIFTPADSPIVPDKVIFMLGRH